MCISVLSTAHPDYPFVLISNRDEFLNRPTAPATWWDPPNQHVLGGRDLHRAERGTWLAITKDGRIAVLTNFREEGVETSLGKSRGGMINAFVVQSADAHASEGVEHFVDRLINDVGIHDVGGFTLLLGELRAAKDGKLPGLVTVSNRTASAQGLTRIATGFGQTCGLSNSHFGDASWPKVVHGEEGLKQAIDSDVKRGGSQADFVESLFGVLSVDTLRRPQDGEPWDVFVRQMRNSIFIPPVGGEAMKNQSGDRIASANGAVTPDQGGSVKIGEGVYGTQKQTVILVDKSGRVKFVERTLYDGNSQSVSGSDGLKTFEFSIEGWQQ